MSNGNFGTEGWTFSQMPIWAACDPRISDGAFRLFSYLVWRQGKDAGCFPSISRMAKDLNLSTASIRRRIRDLEEAGYIRTVERPGRSSIYQAVANPGGKASDYMPQSKRKEPLSDLQGVSDLQGDPSQKCKGTPLKSDTHDDNHVTDKQEQESKGAQAPDLPHNLSDWIQFVKDGQGQPGGMIARLGRMFATLYPDYEPDYGRIGTAAKRVRGAKRLAHLCWLSQGYRVTGDPVDYCEGMHKGNGGSNGRDRSATQQDHNTPSPEELEELKRLVREDKEKREAVS